MQAKENTRTQVNWPSSQVKHESLLKFASIYLPPKRIDMFSTNIIVGGIVHVDQLASVFGARGVWRRPIGFLVCPDFAHKIFSFWSLETFDIGKRPVLHEVMLLHHPRHFVCYSRIDISQDLRLFGDVGSQDLRRFRGGGHRSLTCNCKPCN